MSHPSHVALSQLSIDAVNVRKTGRAAEPIFTGSIRRKGIVEALIVRPNGDGFKITNGGKRYNALCFLRERGESANGIPVTDAYPVPITVRDEDDAAARDTSLLTNKARSAMHPIDEYEAFADLVADGANREQICDEYGIAAKDLQRALALGDLHPKIRDAWRAGEIRTEIAQAFTLTKDQKTQLRVFEKLAKSKQLNGRYAVRVELKAEDQEIGHLLTFVGIEAYEARGGKVTAVDLFEGKHVISDTDLVALLASEKLQAECERLMAAGWGWAAISDGLPSGWRWSWAKVNSKIEYTSEEEKEIKRLTAIMDNDNDDWKVQDDASDAVEKIEAAARARVIGPKQMAKSGCVVSISDDGELKVEYGIIKPDKAKVAAATESEQYAEKRKERVKAKKQTGSDVELSNALVHRLTVQLTRAAAEAVVADPATAFAIGLAALHASRGYDGGPVELKNTGMGAREDNDREDYFVDHFKRVMALTPAQRMAAFAKEVGAAFNFQNLPLNGDEANDVVAICNAIPAKAMEPALRKTFDADDYFNSVSKALCLAAITEAVNADEARKIDGKPKSEIAKFAITNVPKTGWLPSELRTSHYDGPAAKPVKTAPKKSSRRSR